MLIITNNPMIEENVKDLQVITLDNDYIETLKHCRDLVHKGYELLSHPLYGSVKPNETPYRTIIMKKGESLDTNSLNLIEDAIESAQKFKNNKATPLWTERVLDDFRVIDFDIIRNTIQRMQYA